MSLLLSAGGENNNQRKEYEGRNNIIFVFHCTLPHFIQQQR